MGSKSDRDKSFVDDMERIFLTSCYPLTDFSQYGDNNSTSLLDSTSADDVDPVNSQEQAMQIEPEPVEPETISPVPKTKSSTPFLIIRKPHHNLQAFGDTTDSLSTVEIHTRGSKALITEGGLATPCLKFVVDKLQILDDNLRQIDEVVEEGESFVEMIHQRPDAVESKSKANFFASETGDGNFSQEVIVNRCSIENNTSQMKFSKLEELNGNPDVNVEEKSQPNLPQKLEFENEDTNYDIKELEHKFPNLFGQKQTNHDSPTGDAEVKLNDPVSEMHEGIEGTDIREFQPEDPIVKENLVTKDGTDLDSELANSQDTWKDYIDSLVAQLPSFSEIESTSNTVQNVLAATVCVLVIMCVIDNFAST